MLEGKQIYAVEDKAVSTSEDLLANYASSSNELHDGNKTWNILTMEKLITTLIDNKLIHLRELESETSFEHYYDSDSSTYSLPGQKEKEPPDKRAKLHDHHQSSNRRSKHSRNEEKREQRSSISKVQKWSDDLNMETSFYSKSDEEVSSPDRKAIRKKESSARRGSAAADADFKPTAKKRRRRKRKRAGQPKKVSRIDPDDLPRRARWTIIITSGLLILTCMFLVGITLRMAPVIDQMVRTKNEELMNSLNRDTESNPAYYSAEIWDRSPEERAKQKYGRP